MSDDKLISMHIDSIDCAHKRADIPDFAQDGRCSKCDTETEVGYGMAGGGIGIYSYCPSCGIITAKSEDHED